MTTPGAPGTGSAHAQPLFTYRDLPELHVGDTPWSVAATAYYSIVDILGKKGSYPVKTALFI